MNNLELILQALDKAVVEDVKVYDMKERTPFHDYSIIATASSSRQGHAAVQYLKDEASKAGLDYRVSPIEDNTTWFLIDLNEIIVHIFVGQERDYYNLDKMYTNYEGSLNEN